MDDQTKAEYESQSQTLRTELKTWETSWAKSHDGKKPGRDDIKRNAEIAQKYKQYNKVRDILSGKAPPPPKDELKANKRKENPAPATTPSKRHKDAVTPSKNRRTFDDAPLGTPSIPRNLFSPGTQKSIGPTPHRDGQLLGLFDLMVERELGTPSRRNVSLNTTADARIMSTPRKRSSPMDEEEPNARFGRTPMSTSKRQMLDSFMTPPKNKNGTTIEAKTPTTVSKLQFSTPSFLKRHTQPPPAESHEFVAPPLRLPRKPIVRGLSAIVASLRKVEEEKLDDDLEALREAEGEETRPAAPPKPKEDVLAPDDETKNLPLGGFDDEAIYDSSDEEQLGRDGKPLRVFKKKGQKRTTRRSNMKPVQVKRPSAPVGGEDEDDETVPETQMNGEVVDSNEPADVGSGSDFEDAASNSKSAKKTKKAEPAKKPRKVNEAAHTNYRRLKLRNNGAKGGPGHNSKFRRRR